MQPHRPGQPRQPEPPDRAGAADPGETPAGQPARPAERGQPGDARRRNRTEWEFLADTGRRPVPAPTPDELLAAANRTIADLVGPGLQVLFCGINPSLYSAATGHHFARPGNRFWPALHRSGFTARQLHPSEQEDLLGLGLGVTNMVARASARADELSAAELRAGGALLTATLARWRPRWLAVVGVTAYRTAFGRPKAAMGRQEDEVAGVPVWVLPNPSGLNAHYTVHTLAAAFAELREAAGMPHAGEPS